jgi:hypothetical protein
MDSKMIMALVALLAIPLTPLALPAQDTPPKADPAAGELTGPAPLKAEASALVSLLPSAWPPEFREEWLARERAIDEDQRKKAAGVEEDYGKDVAALREELYGDEEELREDFAEDLEELREDFKEKRADILSSDDDEDDKQSDLVDLDDEFFDERDELEADHRDDVAELRRGFDDKAADLARERDQAIRQLAKEARDASERLVTDRKAALIKLHLTRLRTEALGRILSLRGITPYGDPVIAMELADRLGSQAVFVEAVDDSGGATQVTLTVRSEVDPAKLSTVLSQWGMIVPAEPIVVRFSGWGGDTRRAEEALRVTGYFHHDLTVVVEGPEIVATGATYLPAGKVSERLNRIRVGGGEVRSVAEGDGLRVTPFP